MRKGCMTSFRGWILHGIDDCELHLFAATCFHCLFLIPLCLQVVGQRLNLGLMSMHPVCVYIRYSVVSLGHGRTLPINNVDFDGTSLRHPHAIQAKGLSRRR